MKSPCPVCACPFDLSWPLLARQARYEEPIETHVCPSCTFTRTGDPSRADNDRGFYLCRVYGGPPPSLLLEDEAGRIGAPDEPTRRQRLRERMLTIRHAVWATGVEGSPSILHVGAGDGMLLAVAKGVLPGAEVRGLEPWVPWRAAAERRGVPTENTTLEAWDAPPRFDVVIDFDLLSHLPDPVAHLKAIAGRLTERGTAVIGVSNLLGTTGDLARHVLRGDSPSAFTPRALATACRRAGLMPMLIEAGPELRMVCRLDQPSNAVVNGPDAMSVAHSAWGNDLRLSVKRALAEHGPSVECLRTAARVHRRCPSPAARADIAIEIAVHCERCSDYESAAKWLSWSLEDRDDPEVKATLDQLLAVTERVRGVLATQPAEPAAPPIALAS